MSDFRPIIEDAYAEILGRPADAPGLARYDELMNEGLSEADMRESLLRSAEFAARNPERDLARRIGLNVHLPSNAILEDVGANLGVSWIRVDFDWFRIQPEPGVFSWEETDRVVERSRAAAMNVLGVLAYTPAWASSSSSDPRPSDPPSSREVWTRFVREAASRYRSRVRHWQLWNEPNVRQFWRGSAAGYRDQILVPGAAALKEAHPAALAVAPGLTHLGNWREWAREILEPRQAVDVVCHNHYGSSGREVILALERDRLFRPSLRTLLNELGVADRPFWITETGRRSGEGGQLEYYQGAVSALRESLWVDRMFFFHYWDGPGRGDAGFGIVDEDFSPKPAYRFLQSVLRPADFRVA